MHKFLRTMTAAAVAAAMAPAFAADATYNVDVVVVGAGAAGTAAGWAAAEKGLKVVTLEKQAMVGGTGKFSEGIFAVESSMQRNWNYGLTKDEAFQKIMNYGHWRGNAKMVRAFVDKSGETIDWMQANGVKFEKLFSNYPNGLYTWHIYEGRGAGWINLFQQKYKDAGQTLLLNTWGKELIQDKNGTVKGVVATNKNGDKITVNAKATIIATGGFFDNKEMREKYRECEKAVEARCKNDGEPVDRKGVFLGFVLLEKTHWDKGRLIADLKAEWDIDVPEEDKDDRKDNGDSLVFEAGDMIAAVSLMHGPVPGGEAEGNAENNYMWPDAVKAAQSHAAHIMVTVLGKETDVRLRGQFFVKLAAACCRQPGVLGVYTSGVVFEPSFYADMAGVMKEGELPLNNWIWFGLHRREGGVCGYTYGMDVFGKEELEVLDADADPLAVREFLVSLAGYVIGSDVTLNDGETIGFSQGDRHRITRSPGVALPDQPTLKVSFEQNEILLDEAAPHLESIREKCLPVDELNAFSHLAIYLRWCIEHDLMSESFCRRWPDIVEAVRTNPAEACLREWLRDKLKGELHASIFNERGADFACYYYGALHEYTPHYTMDVDIHAVSRIGVERNFSDEIQDEAYLFLPFDEDYYREMARIIERRYENWAGQRFDDSTLAPSETAEALMAYLDCECTYFPSMADDDPIMCAYEYAGKNAAHEGFVPMLIAVDETLWECLMLNSDPAHEGDDDHAFDPDAVAAYRQSQLAAPLPDGRMVLEDGMAERRAEAEDDSKDWDTEVVGRMEGGFNNHRFSGYWNSETDMTHPVILARIPVRHPWEVFAHLPFGNWNDCPDTPQLMAVARYWFEKFGAVPAVMTHDELDFALPKPIGRELAVQTALEQYVFCPDMDQNHESVGALADTLRQSKIWYFWWD